MRNARSAMRGRPANGSRAMPTGALTLFASVLLCAVLWTSASAAVAQELIASFWEGDEHHPPTLSYEGSCGVECRRLSLRCAPPEIGGIEVVIMLLSAQEVSDMVLETENGMPFSFDLRTPSGVLPLWLFGVSFAESDLSWQVKGLRAGGTGTVPAFLEEAPSQLNYSNSQVPLPHGASAQREVDAFRQACWPT